MANLEKQSDVSAFESDTFGFTTLSVLEHSRPDTSVCGCVRPGSCTICRTPTEQAEFRIEKLQQIKDEEVFDEF